MSTWDVLQIARDARLCGRDDLAAQLYAEASDDVPEYVRRGPRRMPQPFWYDDGTDEDGDYEVPSRADQLRECVAANRRIDWLAWATTRPLNLASFDSILKEVYSAAGVSQLAAAPNLALSELREYRDRGTPRGTSQDFTVSRGDFYRRVKLELP